MPHNGPYEPSPGVITRRRRLLARVRVLLRRGTYEDRLVLTPGLVAYWRLSEDAGTAALGSNSTPDPAP